MPYGAWAARLQSLFGAPLDQIDVATLSDAIGRGVREDDDLDFKRELHTNGKDFAADVAALANHRGGMLIIGIRDEDGAAAELVGVPLGDAQETQLRQMAAENLVPFARFDLRAVDGPTGRREGCWLVIVPPSAERPHAVRIPRGVRYPRRHGTTTRWLSEAEIADAYRSRFREAESQVGRLSRIVDEAAASIAHDDNDAWLVVGLVPSIPGAMTIDVARLRAIEAWANTHRCEWTGLWMDTAARTAVGLRRVRVTTIYDDDLAHYVYAELHDDGAAVTARQLPVRVISPDAPLHLGNEALIWTAARCLLFAAEHATMNAAAHGDAAVEARVLGRTMQLGFTQHGHWNPIERGQLLSGPIRSKRTVTLDAVTERQALLAAVRVVLTDLFHAFGSPEIRQIRADGALRILHCSDQRELSGWAEGHGVQVTQETIE